jgi:hypothetical protein
MFSFSCCFCVPEFRALMSNTARVDSDGQSRKLVGKSNHGSGIIQKGSGSRVIEKEERTEMHFSMANSWNPVTGKIAAGFSRLRVWDCVTHVD